MEKASPACVRIVGKHFQAILLQAVKKWNGQLDELSAKMSEM